MAGFPGERIPIAVVGMSFKFGGGADTEESFWQMLVDGRCAADVVPKDRFSADEFYNPDYNRLDTLPTRVGHFLKNDIAAFDAPFFSITPAEAAAMDPQSRALLECTYRGLENAGIPIEKCSGTNTSVYIGSSGDDYLLMMAKDPEHPVRHSATGMARNMLSNKISWFYNLRGSSLSLDSACSSSLNAVHLACESLQSRQSTMALAGGAQLFFTPDSSAGLAHLNFFSPDGKCFSFDSRANGYSRGEGYGMLVLKLLPDAIRDNDNIRAVIRATGSNENGRTPGGITKTNADAQESLIRTTYASAGLDPALTRFVEAHGPGTAGDLVECSAFASVFAKFRTPEEPLYVSSVKANIGHLEGASGIASLVKTILSLERGIIPRLTNFEQLHPDIAAKSYPFCFPQENIAWPPGIRRASVNSFGFGGSNAHIVVEDAENHLTPNDWITLSPPIDRVFSTALSVTSTRTPDTPYLQVDNTVSSLEQRSQQKLSSLGYFAADAVELKYLMVFSAADENGLARIADAYDASLRSRSLLDRRANDVELKGLSYTLAERKTQLPWRAYMIAGSLQDMTDLPHKLSRSIRAIEKPNLAFIFTGQGAQWAQMSIKLRCYSTFKSTLEQCQRIFEELGSTWNLLRELERPPATSNISKAEYSQPICTAVQVALVDLLHSFGVLPTAVLGHSSGEIAAAYCAGALSIHAACKVAFFRGIYSRQIEENRSEECGMMAIGVSADTAATYIEGLQQKFPMTKVVVACSNSPSNVTLSGSREQLQELESLFRTKSVFTRLLHVKVAYHSPYMLPVASAYRKAIAGLQVDERSRPSVQFFSSVSGERLDMKDLTEPEYWVKNLTSQVRFSDALTALHANTRKDGIHALVEVGPHGALKLPATETLSASLSSAKPRYYSTLSRNVDDCQSFIGLIGSLHCLGYRVTLNTEGIYEDAKLIQGLPEYPFDHSRTYWHESRLSKNYRHRKFARSDFIGNRVPDWNMLNPRWRNMIRTLENPWIKDHMIDGTLLYPGAGMLVMAIEAAAQHGRETESAPLTGFRLKNVCFLKSLNISLLPAGTETQIALKPQKDAGDRRATWSAFSVYIYENEEWAECCNGTILLEFEEPQNPVDGARETQNRLQTMKDQYLWACDRCDRDVATDKVYQKLHDYGLQLGPTFKTFDKVRGNSMRETVVDMRLRQWTCRQPVTQVSPHFIHPTTLDGILQLGITALGNSGDDDVPTMVPSRIRNLWVSAHGLDGSGDSHITGHAKSCYRGYRETSMDVTMLSTSELQPRIIVEGLETTIIASQKLDPANVKKTCYKLKWEQLPGLDLRTLPQLEEGLLEVAKSVSMITFVTAGESRSTTLANAIRQRMEDSNIGCVRVLPLLEAVAHTIQQDEVIVFVLDVGRSFFESMDEQAFLVLKHICTQAKRAIWIEANPADPQKRIVGEATGLTRALRTEHEDLKLISLHFASSERLDENITRILSLTTADSGEFGFASAKYEPELLIKADGSIHASRLEEDPEEDQLLVRHDELKIHKMQPFGAADNLKLSIGNPGALDTLQFEEDPETAKELGDSEIEVQTMYGGLNFMDCLTALGRIQQDVLGVECSGIVLRAGSASDLNPGDRVMLCANGTFKSRTRCHYQSAIRIPDNMPFEVAAALPAGGGTVYHALYNVARLEHGESILIHAGAGSTGQIAIQVALAMGATVYVTVGSTEKKNYVLRHFDIPESHIFYSRNTSFADSIKRVTGGRGVDVVFNSLAGDSLVATWECIAPFGRFVEIGKRDIYSHKSLPMFPFAKNVSFHTVDLAGIWQERPTMMRKIDEGVLRLWHEGKLDVARPLHVFPVGQIEDAFRLLQSGKCIGKILIHMDPKSVVPTYRAPQPRYSLDENSTYVISGGLGGLGTSAAQWMVDRGARHLLLLSRSGPKTQKAVDDITALEAKGVQILASRCDIANHAALSHALEQCSRQMPPIRGCIQGAMVLRDKFFRDMTYQDWHESLSPKTDGSWNLHTLLPTNMDFMIFLSSMNGIVGNRGQSNYAAGNTFLDSLASHRVSLGQKAISLDLGMMLEVGVLAENPQLMRLLESEAFYSPMTQNNFHALLDHYCDPSLPLHTGEYEPQLICGIHTAAEIRAKGMKEPSWMNQPLFNAFWTDDSSSPSSANTTTTEYRKIFSEAPTAEVAAQSVSNALVARLARSLAIPETEIEPRRPLHFYGVDSLVAIELRNWFIKELQAEVAVFDILGNRGCQDLAGLAVGRSNFRNVAWGKE